MKLNNLINPKELTDLNRIAGFYDLNNKSFEFLKRSKKLSIDNLSSNDILDYTHGVDEDFLEENNQARFGIEYISNKLICYIQSWNKRNCLLTKKALEKKFPNLIIDTWQIEYQNNFETL